VFFRIWKIGSHKFQLHGVSRYNEMRKCRFSAAVQGH